MINSVVNNIRKQHKTNFIKDLRKIKWYLTAAKKVTK